MIKIVKNILFEPLFHFLLIGAALYLFFASKNELTPEKSIRKVVSIKQIDEESNASMALRVYEEVLLQEAYNLELEKEDALISERLLSKMQFILQGSESFSEPSEESLYAYYKENIEDYSKIESVDFYSMSFDATQDKSLENRLKIINVLDVKALENMQHYKKQTKESLQHEFGRYLTRKLLIIPSQNWSEAIPLNGKTYLIFMDKKRVSKPIDFDMLEGRVYRDYKTNFMRKVRIDAYKKLLQTYRVERR